MGDLVRITRISPERPATRGIFFACVLAVGALMATLAMLAPAAGAQPMYYQQDQMMQPQEQQMQAPAPTAAPAAQYMQEAPAPTTAADQYAAAPSTTPTAMQQQGTTVSIQDFFFAPAQMNVQPGTTVTWVNNGQAPHTVTADDGSFDSETLQPGQSFSFTFANAGTFSYHCEIHPSMTGSVTVGGGGGAARARASAQAPPAGGGHALPDTGGGSPFLAVIILLLGCGALGVFALRRARRTSASERGV